VVLKRPILDLILTFCSDDDMTNYDV